MILRRPQTKNSVSLYPSFLNDGHIGSTLREMEEMGSFLFRRHSLDSISIRLVESHHYILATGSRCFTVSSLNVSTTWRRISAYTNFDPQSAVARQLGYVGHRRFSCQSYTEGQRLLGISSQSSASSLALGTPLGTQHHALPEIWIYHLGSIQKNIKKI